MKLIIAEKPSLAKNIVNGLKLNGEYFKSHGNYYESNNYFVTAVFGHLFTLYDIEDYEESSSNSWTTDNLPYIPSKFKYKLKDDKGIRDQFKLIERLINDPRVASVVNAGDSDREGEIIIRIVLDEANNNKPVYRLWLPEQTEETIAKEIKNMKLQNEYNNLADEGYARQYIDWLYGINLTRYATVKANTLLRVGRVLTPIVRTIYDRELEIKNFVPKNYYQLESKEETKGEIIPLNHKEKYDTPKDLELIEMLNSFNSNNSIVTSLDTTEKIIGSPRLFSQSDLQNYLSKQYKYSPSDTLKLSQSLYEKGFISYPRTATNYLSENEKEKIDSIIQVINGDYNYDLINKESKRIYDDSKIESHSALTPTNKLPNLNDLSDKERNCYQAIFNRFSAVFTAEDHIVNETILVITNNDYDFELKGETVIKEGFTKYDSNAKTKSKNNLPNVEVGDIVNSKFKIIEKQTNPPKYWNVSSLNNYLKNPFRKVDDTEEEEYANLLKGLEIGTEATRSGIIESAIRSEYIKLNNSTYRLGDKGEFLINSLNELDIDMKADETAILGSLLKKVYSNEIAIESLIATAKHELNEIVDTSLEIKQFKKEIDSLGSCPICNKEVIENTKAFTCVDHDCRFTIWKDNNFITKIGKKKLTKTIVKQLLKNGKTNVKGLTAKSGNKYNADIILEVGDKWINLKPDFNN